MKPSYQAVQAGHAVAQWCQRMYNERDESERWYNGTLIYLRVRDLDDLKTWEKKIRGSGLRPQTFVEPDVGDEPTATAVCASTLCGKLLFRKLPLL